MAVVVQRVLWVPFLVLAALGASIARSGAVAPVKAGDTPGHPGGQPLQSVGVLPACTTCSDFCEGRCSFEGPPGVALGVVQNLTVVRYTPSDVPGLTNKNSGDAAGDLYFGLEELVTPMHCRHDPTYFKCQNGTGRFLYYNDTYVRYTIEMDGVFGPYSACNPIGHDDWTCGDPCGGHGLCPGLYISGDNGGTGPPDPGDCGATLCQRARTAVGWIPKGVSHEPCVPGRPCPSAPPPPAPWPASGYQLQSLIGGHWFSTRSEGECVGGARPGDGSGCTWRLLPPSESTVITKAVKCVHARVIQAVIEKNQTCFAGCPDGNDPLPESPSDCWTVCVFATVLGTWDGTNGTPGMSRADVVGLFDAAMEPAASGGCPDLPPPATPAAGSHFVV